MSNKKYQIIEWLCIAALLVFIIVLCVSQSGGTKKSVKDVSAPVIAALEADQMQKQTQAQTTAAFAFDQKKAEGIVYYANDDIMDVSELLIVKLKDKADADAVREAVEKRVEKQSNLYKNYAPDQYSLLQNCVIECSGNTVFYCTAKNAAALYNVYQKAL